MNSCFLILLRPCLFVHHDQVVQVHLGISLDGSIVLSNVKLCLQMSFAMFLE